MYRHKDALSQYSRKILCTALIQSYFDYGVSAWYSATTKRCKNKLQVAQNKMARFILNLDQRSHIGQTELNHLNFLNTGDRAKQIMLNHLFKVFHDRAPAYLSLNFKKSQSQHQYGTRHAQYNFAVPMSRGPNRFNFSVDGVKHWNNLPSAIKSQTSRAQFKKHVKKHLKERALSLEQSEFVPY